MFHPPPHKVQAPTGPCSIQTVVVMAKIARPHNLIEKETAQSLIRFTQQILLTQAKHLTFHPHHGTCKAKQVEPSQKFQDILLCMEFFWTGFQDEVEIHQLPQSYTLEHQMPENMIKR